MGLLAYLYRYAEVCYVGGGFNKGIHNVLEPAVYGKPVITGMKYKKFKEAVDLHDLGSLFLVDGSESLQKNFNLMSTLPVLYSGACRNAKEYVEDHKGGTRTIMEAVKTYL
ncbi:MAG: 3-deoxy-D-manno-octulosonic acid transferase, partial [Chitinophagales bacterium]|nr:3-deoxy-D-manno-octulosonic acid transferase [Chitinophagales bacterium]